MKGKHITDIKEMKKKIKKMHKLAEELLEEGEQFEAVKRNTKRLLASVVMIELNICCY